MRNIEINAVIVDDSSQARKLLRMMLTELAPDVIIKGEAANVSDAVALIQQVLPDVVFLDIEMPGKSGLQLVDELSRTVVPYEVIFTTAYNEYALKAFRLSAIDYLLKPFSLPRFLKACNKAHEQAGLKKNIYRQTLPADVFIKSGYGQVRVSLDDILYAESNGNYMQFVLTDKKIVSRLTMSETEALLPAA